MPVYQPFVISAFKTGMYTAHEPDMTPSDGFPTLLDARVDRGFLTKRLGYTELADTSAGNPIMGIHGYMRRGHPNYLVADTKRLYTYHPYGESFTDLSTADTYNGGDKDFFWFQSWRDKCYFCNGVDLPYVYDEVAETLESLDTISDADLDIQIDSCQMIFRYKSRLIFLNCTVDGKWYPNRLYYSEINLTRVKATNWVDGDQEDVFVSGCYVNGIPTLFGHEGFIVNINYTFNADAPFAFQELDRSGGVLGPLVAPTSKKLALAVGHEGLVTWDGYQSRKLGPQIRDFVDNIDNLQAWYMTAAVRRDRAIVYLGYPNDGSTSNDRILEYNIDENAFSIHKISPHVLVGTTSHMIPEVAFITAELGDPEDDVGTHDLHVVRHPDYRAMTLMGGHTGKLYLMNYGTTDDGTAISSEVWTAAVNPFKEQGRKAYFGRCRVLVGTHASKSCTVSFYKDQLSSAWKTETLSAVQSGTGDEHWVELHPGGEVGNYHRLAFTGDLPDIHALELGFAPAGRLDNGLE